MYMSDTEQVRRECWIPWFCSQRLLGASMWVLETEAGSFARGTSALNCGPISPAPIIAYFYRLILMGIILYDYMLWRCSSISRELT